MTDPEVEVGIVADDLSGAADCAVAFRRAGLSAAVVLRQESSPLPTVSAVAIPTASRDRDADFAIASVTTVAERLRSARPSCWYKKIDSTLRGHLAEELRVVIDAAEPELTVLAPAFPSTGRTVVRGRGYLRGMPLERTALWRAAGRDDVADLPAILDRGGLLPIPIRLEEIRSGITAANLDAASAGHAVLVCDAESDDDLDAIIDAATQRTSRVLWVGSAGLAYCLAGRFKRDDHAEDTARHPRLEGPVLVVVGSAAEEAREQLRTLLADTGMAVVSLEGSQDSAAQLRRSTVEASDALGVELDRGRDVAVSVSCAPSGQLDPTQARELTRALAELAGTHHGRIGGFVLTGGETADAVLRASQVTALRLVGEVETGVPVSIAVPDGRPVVTKAGAFGDAGTLLRAFHELQAH